VSSLSKCLENKIKRLFKEDRYAGRRPCFLTKSGGLWESANDKVWKHFRKEEGKPDVHASLKNPVGVKKKQRTAGGERKGTQAGER